MRLWKMSCSRLALCAVQCVRGGCGVRVAVAQCSTHATPGDGKFDVKMLEFLACPLSKKPLRYDASTSELVCDDIGVAYPIRDGIPCLIPDDGRLLKKENQTKKP